ncbi:MAG: DUF533 domain-containing protein [Vicinamibacteraceae bacterium]|nr:DUF533 domain-containing protein [Vicinamibacteraceae bacterium]
MDIEQLLGGMLRGALGGRRKPHRKALRYLTGRQRGFLTPARMVGLAGLAWGVIETVMAQRDAGVAAPTAGAPAGASPRPTGPPSGAPAATAHGVMAGAAAPPVVPPPLPAVPPPVLAPPSGSGLVDPAVSGPLGRVVQLTISAARADGTLTDEERASIVDQARRVGLESLVDAELASPTPVEDIVSGLGASAASRDLYTMAFSIVRADADVDAAERAYLARLAAALGLDAEAVAAIERETERQIEAFQ